MPYRDEAGRPVPEKLVAPFRAKGPTLEWLEVFRAMPILLREQLAGSNISDDGLMRVEDQIARLADLVESFLPVAVCLCKGLHDDCCDCGGKGWLSYGEAILMKAARGDLPKDEAWLREVRSTFKAGSRAKSKLAASWKLAEAKKYVVSALELWRAPSP